jgi:hypothetical protein
MIHRNHSVWLSTNQVLVLSLSTPRNHKAFISPGVGFSATVCFTEHHPVKGAIVAIILWRPWPTVEHDN